MSFTSGSPTAPSAAQAKLANKYWRWRNSWWIFAPIIGCGFFGFIGFLVAAIRTGKRHYWISTVIYASLGALAMALIIIAGEDKDSAKYVLGDIAIIPFLVAAFGPIIHAAIKNREYLTDLAEKSQWYEVPPGAAGHNTDPTSFAGVSNSDYFAFGQEATPQEPDFRAQQPSAAPPADSPPNGSAVHSRSARRGDIDINRAGQAELATGLGIGDALAAQVISARSTHGRFNDLDDLANKASLQPHQLVRFRNMVTFGDFDNGPQHPTTGPTGRILDF